MAQLLPADNLAQVAAEARAKRVPILIAFMQESCPYCAIARRDYLVPLQTDPDWRHRVLIREIDVDRTTTLRDFKGASSTHKAFARSHNARRVPTLIFFDAEGNRIGPPIVGLFTEDFYRLYIEQGIEAGLAKMHRR